MLLVLFENHINAPNLNQINGPHMGNSMQIRKNEPDFQRALEGNLNGGLTIYNFEEESIQKNDNEI